jgi:hypothetical protein
MGRHRSTTIPKIRRKLAFENGATNNNNNTPAAAPSAPVPLMARAICNATDFICAPPFTKRRKGLELHLRNGLTPDRGKGTRLVGRDLALRKRQSQEQCWSCHSKMRVSGLCKARSCVCKSRLRAEINGVEVNPERNFRSGFTVQRDDYEWHTAPGRQENPN